MKGRSRRGTGLLAGFHQRSTARVLGAFVTRADIEKQRAHTTTALLRRIPGVQLVPRPLGGGHTVMLRGTCAPMVYIDGIKVRLFSGTIDDLVTPQALEGIEVYRSAAEVPAEYSGLNAGCGVILLWTRRGRDAGSAVHSGLE
ncbi:MAG TPA: Plug domain-containing protein [Longimicrobiaceae bacterium]|nr:Plug domain-containing protein [Longimicrobiaceae bacterium]